MPDKPLPSLDAWCKHLQHIPVPVLAGSLHRLRALQEQSEDASLSALADIIGHDPLLALNLLRYQSEHRSALQQNDSTTIQHSLMMMGLQSFFKNHLALPNLEENLAKQPIALAGIKASLQRSHLAAQCAMTWAAHRHDIDNHEVEVAALLHDIAEQMIWIVAPKLMLEIKSRQHKDWSQRSADIQKQVLGFTLIELQSILVKDWGLPRLLRELMDDLHAETPRVQNVATACAYARHCTHSWQDIALADDYLSIAKLLNISVDQSREITWGAVLKSAHAWQCYGIRPAAAYILEQH